MQGIYSYTWPFPYNDKTVEIGGRKNIIRVFTIGKKTEGGF